MSQENIDLAQANTLDGTYKKRNWTGIFISSLLGGVVAVVAAPTIAALMPLGAVGFTMGTVTTGVIGSTVSKFSGNAIDASSMTLTFRHYQIQQFYRRALIPYIGTILDSVLGSVRTNTSLEYNNRVFFDLGDRYRFNDLDVNEQRRWFFDLSFHVLPKHGSSRRDINDSVPPEDLPDGNHEAATTIVVGNNKRLGDGVAWAMAEGAVFGVIGGALPKLFPVLGGFTVIPTVPNKVNLIVGMSSASGIAGPLKNIAFPTDQIDKAILFMDFTTEVGRHVTRLKQCAIHNDVRLEVDMRIGSTTNMQATIPQINANGTQNQEFYWNTKLREGFD